MKKILVVDDEAEMLDLLEGMLDPLGLDFTKALSGMEALGHLAVTKFDVIITDLTMPGMDGIQLIGYVKANEKNGTTPILVVSGDLNEGRLEKIRELGVAKSIAKPVDMDELLDMMQMIIAPKKAKVVAYHPNVVNLIMDSTTEIVKFYMDAELTRKNFKLKENNLTPLKFNTLVPIFGRRVFGSISISFGADLANYLGTCIFGEEQGEGILDITGEIGNQVASRAKSKLIEKNVLVNIGLPQMKNVKGIELKHLTAGRVASIELEVEGRSMFVEFCFGNWLEPNFDESEDFKIFLTSHDVNRAS